MIRLAAVALALVAAGVPLLVAPLVPVAAAGLLALLLAAAGIATLWRWPLTVAACVLLVDYAGALWLTAAPLDVVRAAVFGLALVLLLETAELARCARGATVDAKIAWSQLLGWAGFGAGALAAVMLAVAVARLLVPAIPGAAAPFLAAAGVLGVALTLAVALTRRARATPHDRLEAP